MNENEKINRPGSSKSRRATSFYKSPRTNERETIGLPPIKMAWVDYNKEKGLDEEVLSSKTFVTSYTKKLVQNNVRKK